MSETRGTGSVAHGIDQGISYRIDRDRRILAIIYIGRVTLEDMLAAQDLVRADPAFDPTFSMLLDARKADFQGFGAEDLWRIGNATPAAPGAKRAIVVNSKINFGLARMFHALRAGEGDDFPLGLFETIEDAVCWLARPPG